MLHIINSCQLTKFDGDLLYLHEVNEAAITWLAYDNNNIGQH